MTTPPAETISGIKTATHTLLKSALYVAVAGVLVIGGFIIFNASRITIRNDTGSRLQQVDVQAGGKMIFRGALEPGQAVTMRFVVTAETQYSVDVDYRNGGGLHAKVGYLDPINGANDVLAIGNGRIVFNNRVVIPAGGK
jgi:hypothetical protein